ncbi:DUF3093 domain-containing protein [Glycomyces sp. A-F 0318]|uniref:DUF3093 domain-containing protein n=1 Tax=Glycomyces amatae TaxID=2881355 RepID=UPI001E30717E|nr:DUF3093 domain-containing protein [Glycomyces amatae]MCD0443831.1 DUF3093 domain-containing protein [Glycomyces amatae]
MRSGERYAERMSLPAGGWLAVLATAVIAAALSNLGDMRWWRVAASLVILVAPVAAAWWMGRLPVRVVETDGEVWLHVDDARLPMSAVAEVEVLEPVAYSDALGVALHPLTFVVQRPWINRGVRIVLDDPEDPTPSWVVASRRPERLRAALAPALEGAAASGGPRG